MHAATTQLLPQILSNLTVKKNTKFGPLLLKLS